MTSKMPDSQCKINDHLPVGNSNVYPVLLTSSNIVMSVKLYTVPAFSEETTCVTDVSSLDVLTSWNVVMPSLLYCSKYVGMLFTLSHIRVILVSLCVNTVTSLTFSGAKKTRS